jgi:hypothetical protein
MSDDVRAIAAKLLQPEPATTAGPATGFADLQALRAAQIAAAEADKAAMRPAPSPPANAAGVQD